MPLVLVIGLSLGADGLAGGRYYRAKRDVVSIPAADYRTIGDQWA